MSKRARVLELLLQHGEYGLNRFDAMRLAHDHVLPSTVASLHKRGVHIDVTSEDVPGFGGRPTRVARYWIPQTERERARRILDELRTKKAPAAGTTDASNGIGGAADVHLEQ